MAFIFNIFAIPILFLVSTLLGDTFPLGPNHIFFIALTLSILVLLLLLIFGDKKPKGEQLDHEELRNLDEKDFESFEKARRLRDEKEKANFLANVQDGFLLSTLAIENTEFFQNLLWKFEPNINVLLGRNGYGKSYLLRTLAALIQKEGDVVADHFCSTPDAHIRMKLFRNARTNVAEIIYRGEYFKKSPGKIPLLAIPGSRFINQSDTTLGPIDGDDLALREYGAHHLLHQKPYDRIILSLIYELCLDYYEHDKKISKSSFSLLVNVFKKLSGESFSFHSIERKGRNGFVVYVVAEGQKDPIPLQYASQGTLSILAIFGTIHSFLKSLNPDLEGDEIRTRPGIVIIDEVDAHLHPVWQKKITRILRETFPNVQFILSAHSPLIVAGCMEYETAILRKTSNGSFTVEQLDRHFMDLSPQELYERVFEIEEISDAIEHYTARASLRKGNSEKINRLEKKKARKKLSPLEERELSRLLREARAIRRVMEAKSKKDRPDYEERIMELEARNRSLRRRLEDLKK